MSPEECRIILTIENQLSDTKTTLSTLIKLVEKEEDSITKTHLLNAIDYLGTSQRLIINSLSALNMAFKTEFSGNITHVKYYDKALNEAEVIEEFTKARTGE